MARKQIINPYIRFTANKAQGRYANRIGLGAYARAINQGYIELIENTGNPFTSTDGFAGNNTTVSIENGKIKIENSAAAYGNATYPFPTEVGETYTIEVSIETPDVTCVVAINSSGGGGSGTRLAQQNVTGDEVVKLTAQAVGTTTWIAYTNNLNNIGNYHLLVQQSARKGTQ